MQPGDSIMPDGSGSQQPVSQTGSSQPSEPTDSAPESSLETSTPPSNESVPDQADNGGWTYTEDDPVSKGELNPITWSASEYIDHEKKAGWFLTVGGIAVALGVVIYLLTRDVINSIVILVVASLFAVSGARRPRTLQYGLDKRGIHIGNKFYDYNEFKSFSIMDDGGLSSIQLLQFKRFTTPITLYFPPEQGGAIIDFLGSYLPHETRTHDPIDRLMRKVRF